MGDETYRAKLLQLAHKTSEDLTVEDVLDRHTDIYFRRADEVDNDAEPVERAEYARQEAMADTLAIALDVENHDALLDRDRGRKFAHRLCFNTISERKRQVSGVDRACAHVQWLPAICCTS